MFNCKFDYKWRKRKGLTQAGLGQEMKEKLLILTEEA